MDVVKCPVCDGQGIVSRPPWIAGDQQTWVASEATYPCQRCGGCGTIHDACENCGILEAEKHRWKSESTRLAKLAEEYKAQRDRARELAGELWVILWSEIDHVYFQTRYAELEQRLKAEGVKCTG